MSVLSCIEVTFRRVGGLVGSFARRGSRLAASFIMAGGMTATFGRSDARLMATATRVGKARCTFGLVCSNSIGDEDVLWALDGKVFNVFGHKVFITRK